MASPVDDFWANVNTNNSKLVNDLLSYICKNYVSENSTMFSMCSTTSPPSKIIQIEKMEQKYLPVSLELPTASKYILTFLLVAILTSSVVGNALVMLSITFNKKSFTNIQISILSLAVSDILFSVTCVPILVDQVINAEWTFESSACKVLPFFMQLSISANMLTLCCMAVDRFLAIVYPLKFTSFKTIRTSQCLILCSWAISIAAALPQPHYFDMTTVCGRMDQDGHCRQHWVFSLCMVRHDVNAVRYKDMKWISFSFLFLFPATVLCAAYGIIIHTLWVKANVGMVVLSIAATRNKNKKRSVAILLTVLTSFLLCWTPIQVWSLVALHLSLDATSTTQNVDKYLKCLALSSTTYNPLIYAFMNQKFRTDFKNILLRRRGVRVSPLVIINMESPKLVDPPAPAGRRKGSPVTSTNTVAGRGSTTKNAITKLTGLTTKQI